MSDPDAEHTAEEEGKSPKPEVGTDPGRTPQDDDDGPHRVVSPDEEQVEEAERERKEKEDDESPEEHAERIKDA